MKVKKKYVKHKLNVNYNRNPSGKGGSEGGKAERILKTVEDVMPEGWQKTVLELRAEGLTKEEVYLHYFHIKPGLFKALWKREPELNEICRQSDALCKAWWVRQGKEALHGRYFQAFVWFCNMKNRFGWRDKVDLEHSIPPSLIAKLADKSVIELKETAYQILNPKRVANSN